MINKKQSRLRRARATRARILLQKVDRLTVHRTNLHIYASIISADNGRTLVSASTVEPEVRAQLASVSGRGGNVAAAKIVGARIAEKAKAALEAEGETVYTIGRITPRAEGEAGCIVK